MTGPKLKGCRCQCAACGEYFGSERACDWHRIGSFAEPGRWHGTRCCMDLGVMMAAGWQRNARGFLLQPDPRRAGAGNQDALQTRAATWAPVAEDVESAA